MSRKFLQKITGYLYNYILMTFIVCVLCLNGSQKYEHTALSVWQATAVSGEPLGRACKR